MNAEEAWERVRLRHDDSEAWEVLCGVAVQAAQRVSPAYADDAMGQVLCRLHETARNHRLPRIEKSVYAYMYKSISRLAHLMENRARRPAVVTSLERPHPRQFLHVLEQQVVPMALMLREPWRQDGAAADWQQLRRLLEERITLPKLLWGSNAPRSAAKRKSILAATYKRHERLRTDLFEAIDILEQSTSSDQIDTNTANRYRWMVAGLRRRRSTVWYEGASSYTRSLALTGT